MDNNQYWLTNIATNADGDIRSLDPSLKILHFEDSEEEIIEGVFQIFFYPQGNTSGGVLKVKFLKGEPEAPLFLVSLDPITGKPHVEKQNG